MWESKSFYTKSKLYIQRSEQLRPEDRFYIFWHLLALELLIKACVSLHAKPLLAAEGKEGQNLLYALGIAVVPNPVQRSISELISFLTHLVPTLKKEDRDKLFLWMGYRNEELHSGSDKLSELANTGWSSDYFRVTKLLLDYLGKDLSDYYGSDKKSSIEKMISELNKETLALAKAEISKSQTYYAKRLDSEKESVRKNFKRPYKTKDTKCPSCGEPYAVIYGELINSTGAMLDEDGDLHVIYKYMPIKVVCEMCRLQLDGYSLISAAGLGAEFSIKSTVDPIETFDINIEEEFNSMYPGRDVKNQYDEYMDE